MKFFNGSIKKNKIIAESKNIITGGIKKFNFLFLNNDVTKDEIFKIKKLNVT